MPRIQINVEKMLDRGPKYGWLEVQVGFEQQTSPEGGMAFASVIISLPKAEVGKISFDQIRAAALSKAVSFMQDCVKSAAAS